MFDFFTKTYYGNTFEQWLITFTLIAFSIIIGKIFYWFTSTILKKITKKTNSKLDDILVDMMEEPLIMIGVLTCIWYSISSLTLSPNMLVILKNIFYFLVIINIAWLITRTIDALIDHYIVPLVKKTETDLDDVLLPIINTVFKLIVWSLAIVIGLNNAGYNLGAVLAGMGIGGLAIAIASKETLTNTIGGVTVMVTRPFKVDDRIRVNGVDGWVKNIKLNSTIIKDFKGRIHIIPNRIFIDNIIENVDEEQAYYEVERFKLRHDTNSAQIELVREILKEIILTNKLFEDNYWITFDKIGDYSFDIEFWYAIKKWHNSDKLIYAEWYQKKSAAKNYLHITIMKQFEINKIRFALPIESRIFPSSQKNSLFSANSADTSTDQLNKQNTN